MTGQSPPSRPPWWVRADRWLTVIETALLALILAAMVALAGTQVVLRNLFDSGLVWADPMTRALVLWLALVGGFAAARRQKHIRIDLLSHYAGPRLQSLVLAIIAAASSAVCGLIAWHGGKMVLAEIEYGDVAFGMVPSWLVQSIIPMGFGLIALAYLVHGVLALPRLVQSKAPK